MSLCNFYLKIKTSAENNISFKKTMLLRITLKPWYLADTSYEAELVETPQPEHELKKIITLKVVKRHNMVIAFPLFLRFDCYSKLLILL